MCDCSMELVTGLLTPRVDQRELGFSPWMSGTLCHVSLLHLQASSCLHGDHRSSALERSDTGCRGSHSFRSCGELSLGFCPSQTPIPMPLTTHGDSGQTALLFAFTLNGFGYSSLGASHILQGSSVNLKQERGARAQVLCLHSQLCCLGFPFSSPTSFLSSSFCISLSSCLWDMAQW